MFDSKNTILTIHDKDLGIIEIAKYENGGIAFLMKDGWLYAKPTSGCTDFGYVVTSPDVGSVTTEQEKLRQSVVAGCFSTYNKSKETL